MFQRFKSQTWGPSGVVRRKIDLAGIWMAIPDRGGHMWVESNVLGAVAILV